MNRRNFLRAGAVGAVSLNNFPYHLFAGETKKYATDLLRKIPAASTRG